MARNDRDSSILNRIRAAIGRDSDASTDAELLGRFVSNQDNDAFELLVWRHSGTILRTCRAVLHDHHAAEDALQATFLALARKARSFKHRESIIGWLYCTARRISIRSARRRSKSLVTIGDMSVVAGSARVAGLEDVDEVEAIHQELAHLPEKYRLPILLCCFEGLTLADAARRLGWPLPTVGTRLARGKKLLHRRLTRCGVVIPAAGVAALITVNPIGAVKAASVTSTARAAAAFASGNTIVRGISEEAVRMAQEELRRSLVGNTLWTVGIATCLSTMIGVGAYFSGNDGSESARPRSIDTANEVRVSATVEISEAPAPRKKVEPDQATVKRYKALGAVLVRINKLREEEDLELTPSEVDTFILPGFMWRSIPAKGLPELPEVDVPFGLRLMNARLRDTDVARFAKLKNLTALYLSFCGVTDNQIKAIAEAPDIKMLTLAGNRVTDAGMEHLASVRKLELLELSYTLIGDPGIRAITRIDGLQGLWLTHTYVTDEGLKELGKITGLKLLYLMQTDITDEGLKHLQGLRQLRTLHLGRTSITDEGLRRLAPLRQLVYLDLCHTSVTDRGMTILAESHPNLETLNLFETQVTEQGLRNLAPLTDLKGICLSGCPITGEGLRELTRHRELDLILLGGTRVKDRDLSILNSFEKLQTLSLQSLDVSDAGLKSLTELKNLKSIDLIGTRVTGTVLQPARFPNLKMIDLSATQVNEDGLRVVGGNDSLTELHLNNCSEVTDQGIQCLVNTKNLRRLEVMGTSVTRSGAQRLNRLRGERKSIVIQGSYWTEPPQN